MPIDRKVNDPQDLIVDLDSIDEKGWRRWLAKREKAPPATVSVSLSIKNGKGREKICDLRASSVAALLRMRRDESTSPEDLQTALEWLCTWDQLSLANVIELCGSKFPPGGLAPLSREAAIELKWFQEWQLAAIDPRIYKIPGLPWRRFLRRINEENFAFAVDLMKLDGEELVQRIYSFLDAKKKTVSLFPKRWN